MNADLNLITIYLKSNSEIGSESMNKDFTMRHQSRWHIEEFTLASEKKFTFAYKIRGIHLTLKNSDSWAEADQSDLMSSKACNLQNLRVYVICKLQVVSKKSKPYIT